MEDEPEEDEAGAAKAAAEGGLERIFAELGCEVEDGGLSAVWPGALEAFKLLILASSRAAKLEAAFEL